MITNILFEIRKRKMFENFRTSTIVTLERNKNIFESKTSVALIFFNGNLVQRISPKQALNHKAPIIICNKQHLFRKLEQLPPGVAQPSKASKERSKRPGPEVIKLFSYSTQLSMKFVLLINVKMPTIVGILTFISMINTPPERLKARHFFICRYFSF